MNSINACNIACNIKRDPEIEEKVTNIIDRLNGDWRSNKLTTMEMPKSCTEEIKIFTHGTADIKGTKVPSSILDTVLSFTVGGNPIEPTSTLLTIQRKNNTSCPECNKFIDNLEKVASERHHKINNGQIKTLYRASN